MDFLCVEKPLYQKSQCFKNEIFEMRLMQIRDLPNFVTIENVVKLSHTNPSSSY